MAKRFFRVQTADRPDLAAIGGLTQLDVMGYAFPKIFPLIPVSEKGGTMTVAPAGLTASKGEKGRANSATLTGTEIAMVDVNWTAARYEGRGKLYENDGAAYASEQEADAAGAELAQRLAWNKAEDEAFKTVFTSARKSAASTLTDQQVVKILQQKAKSLRKYGKPVLVMTTNTWLDFCEIPEIKSRFRAFAVAGGDIGFLTTAKPQVLQAVSTMLAFEDIILFDSEIVDSGDTYSGIVNVMALRPEAKTQPIATIKGKATYGWTACYIPEDAPADKPFDMRCYYDNGAKANVYDAEAYLGITEAFSAAVAPCKLADSYTPEQVRAVQVQVGS